MKKHLSLMLVMLLLLSCLTACSAPGSEMKKDAAKEKTAETAKDDNKEETKAESQDETKAAAPESASGKKLRVVSTIFPEYDWVSQVLGDKAANVDLTMLLNKGVDLHSYQPTAEDIMKIASCDLFIYVGGESDGWVKDALKEATNKDMKGINLLEVLGSSVKAEEMVEGMQEGEHAHEHGDDEHDHEHEEGEEADEHDHEHEEGEEAGEHDHEHHHGEGEPEYDEHVWLSLKHASVLTGAIADALAELDPANAAAYKDNAAAYQKKLMELDEKYQKTVDNASLKTVLFGDRFPFRYLADDYGLSYYAAFVGCSAETEASFDTITFLAGKVDELGLPAVLTIEGDKHKIAETIVQNTKTKDQEILTMDSLQSVTGEDVAQGASYLAIMEQNLEVLKKALK